MTYFQEKWERRDPLKMAIEASLKEAEAIEASLKEAEAMNIQAEHLLIFIDFLMSGILALNFNLPV